MRIAQDEILGWSSVVGASPEGTAERDAYGNSMRSKATRRLPSRSTRRAGNGTKYKYDPEADVLLITLSRGKPDFAEQSQNVITHYNKAGKPIEIELLNASQTALDILEAMMLQQRASA